MTSNTSNTKNKRKAKSIETILNPQSKASMKKEEALVIQIAECLNHMDRDALKVGEYIDAVVNLRGGIQYGDSTLDTLAQRPEINRSREYLVRCWRLFLLLHKYGSDIGKISTDIPKTYLYHVGRLLGLNQNPADEKALVLRYVQYVYDVRKQGKLSVDDFSKIITQAIDEIKAGKRNGEIKPEPKPDPKKKGRKSAIGKLLSFDEQGLEEMVSYFENFAKPEHLDRMQLNVPKVLCLTNRFETAFTALMNYLALNGESDYVRDCVNSSITQLQHLSTDIAQKHPQN